MQNFQAELLKEYQVVVFAEADEFLFVNGCLLSERCEKFIDENQSSLTCAGLGVIHQIDNEVSYSLQNTSLLQNRSSMWCLPSYNKTLITKIPLNYSIGFHKVVNGVKKEDRAPDEGLSLLHMWHFDIGTFIDRRMTREKLPLVERTICHGSSAKGGPESIENIQRQFRTQFSELKNEIRRFVHWRAT